ncbi:[FeFe] hydrogenase H-cluster radical SAM maturase HydE [candidate division WOR-3 bacterium]|uniref:[FeFe] hydrogenase H-cluster radical SAM maturase HydE n=1 Tax=candidate division WOR-3 bacterium TaxID=2052148 RepID=A0A937XGC0_UNCW3|nr:[FeFe] hydrogenase H-cluster radical SAM maturase HydE [candidate division WOR-3 bacterium]
MTRDEVLAWLKEEEDWKLSFLWEEADRVRREQVGDEVHLRGLIEMSSFCRRDCHYCGIRGSRKIERYRMSEEEVMECVRIAQRLEYGTVVLQSGEDHGLTSDFITHLVRRIKSETPLAVTLALGERSLEELAAWREAGADRYLLKHETSDPELFRRIHPDCSTEVSDRIALLKAAKEMGYEAGSGVMVGIPGQTYESLADDIMLFRDLDLEMIGCGPFVPHPDTPLGQMTNDESRMTNVRAQVPATDTMTTKVVALTRLLCPDANIPSTTALATINRERGREMGLERGANVWMPNLTQPRYRALYEIYPGKAKVIDTAEEFQKNLLATLERIGRVPGKGPGGRLPRVNLEARNPNDD